MNSIAPAAPMLWPIMDLIELTGISCARLPKTRLMASVSDWSLSLVAVPCALMWSISSGLTPASFSAREMAFASPSGSGNVMRAARDGQVQGFEHDYPCAFGKHEAIAVGAERPAGALGRVVAGESTRISFH